MAAGFFAVFDDIAALLDDAAAVSKVAAKKTVGILGDDLAVNAQKASGFAASRELPVLWAITKGSFVNKAIILPISFLLSAFAPWAVVPILMMGGVYLSYEGAEKIYEYFVPHTAHEEKKLETQTEEEILAIEKSKVKSAIRTDFILSIEIVIMALGTVLEQTLLVQIIAVSVVATMATIGVYGIVALIVRMDDFGFKLIALADGKSTIVRYIGEILVISLPKVIRILTVVGTIAMLLVAGGIFSHNVEQLHHILPSLPSIIRDLLIGMVLGAIVLSLQQLYTKFTAQA